MALSFPLLHLPAPLASAPVTVQRQADSAELQKLERQLVAAEAQIHADTATFSAIFTSMDWPACQSQWTSSSKCASENRKLLEANSSCAKDAARMGEEDYYADKVKMVECQCDFVKEGLYGDVALACSDAVQCDEMELEKIAGLVENYKLEGGQACDIYVEQTKKYIKDHISLTDKIAKLKQTPPPKTTTKRYDNPPFPKSSLINTSSTTPNTTITSSDVVATTNTEAKSYPTSETTSLVESSGGEASKSGGIHSQPTQLPKETATTADDVNAQPDSGTTSLGVKRAMMMGCAFLPLLAAVL